MPAVEWKIDELDDEGNAYKRGLKMFAVPAHTQSSCRDISVRCVKFVLPEDPDVSDTMSMCNRRNLRVKVFASYGITISIAASNRR